MYDQLKRHQILVLRDAGFSLRQVARKADVGLSTVCRTLRQERPSEASKRALGRPPVVTAFEEATRQILEERGDLPTVEVLRRLRERGYSGGKDPIYRLVRQVQKVVTPPMVRFEGLAGEFSQNDFGSVRVR